jgi:hypothetical protein
MCGPSEIDGYAFCMGVDSLNKFFKAHADANLRSLIRSVCYLIRGAIFRPNGLGGGSQDICPLGELVDMYHTHEATLRSDKVYALLGMSSDDLSNANLSPDYKVPWKELFETLTRFLLCKEIFVEASPDKEIAVIKSKGRILGEVSSVPSDIARDGRQGVDIILKGKWGNQGYTRMWKSHWTLQASAKSIRNGDLICLLQGASKPTIIRVYEDHCAILLIAATPPENIQTESEDIAWSEFSQSAKFLPTLNFEIVWDWENLSAKSQGPEDLKESEHDWEKAARSWNFASVLEAGGFYTKAEEKFREAMESYEIAVRHGYDTVPDQLSLRNGANLNSMISRYGWTLLSWAAGKGHEATVKLLLETGTTSVTLKDMEGRRAFQAAAGGGHLAVIERLLQEKAEVNAAAARQGGRTALQAAAGGGHLAVVEWLLQEKAEVNAAAAR